MQATSPVVRFLFGTACFIVVVAGMRTAESLLVPFFLSLFISVLCSPPLIWLKGRGVPNGLAIFIIIPFIQLSSISCAQYPPGNTVCLEACLFVLFLFL